MPDYLDVVKEPMHFMAMRKKVTEGAYTSIDAIEADLRLIVANAQLYNKPDTPYHVEAGKLLNVGLQRIAAARARSEGECR